MYFALLQWLVGVIAIFSVHSMIDNWLVLQLCQNNHPIYQNDDKPKPKLI
jgi:hypothetical protein